jgi:cell division protein FtsL
MSDNGRKKAGKSKDDALSTSKVVASAAAAVTASLLTSYLTGYLNSIWIVAITSIVIAVASELYSRTLKKMKKAGAKAALQIVQLPDALNEKLAVVAADTATMDPVSEDTIVDTATGDDHSEDHRSKIVRWIENLSGLTKMIIVIMVMAIMSIGASWLFTSIMEGRPDVTNITQQVTKKEVVNLSDGEKKAIQEAAEDAIQPKINALYGQISSQKNEISDLTDQMNDLKAGQNTSSPSPSASESSPSTDQSNDDADQSSSATTANTDEINRLKTQVMELQTQIKTMQDEITKLQASGSGSASNGGSTTQGR